MAKIQDVTGKVSLQDIIYVARSLFEHDGDVAVDDPSEYARGVCELVGRVMLDMLHQGEGTYENAVLVAKELGIRSDW